MTDLIEEAIINEILLRFAWTFLEEQLIRKCDVLLVDVGFC
jgi:hypothetical protein